MGVKGRSDVAESLDRAQAALREATDDLERTRSTVDELISRSPGLTVRELADRFHMPKEAVVAFVETAGELLGGVSRQRVDELLRSRRLIGLRDRGGRRWYPAFQFHDGRPLEPLVAAFWTGADGVVSEWTAAGWCTAPDDALEGRSPAQWAREQRDPDRLADVARQDAARLAR